MYIKCCFTDLHSRWIEQEHDTPISKYNVENHSNNIEVYLDLCQKYTQSLLQHPFIF